MPTLIGAAVLALGGLVVMRLARREWHRVNRTMDAQRSTPSARQSAQKLEKDPETGAYKPVED